MYSVRTHDLLASASAVFCGRYGDVTRLAQQRGACRQTLYRQAHGAAHALEPTPGQQPLPDLRRQLEQAHGRIADLECRLAQAVVVEDDGCAAFAATAQAHGVSLPIARTLLAVLAGDRTPSVARLGRLSQAAAGRAAALLEVLDQASRPRARQVAPDELFSGQRPVLMTVEPQSLCWLGGRLAQRRDAATWAAELAALPALEQVTRDAAAGLQGGVRQLNQQRQAQGLPPVADQDDHFHVLREGRRGLVRCRNAAARALAVAEKAQAQLQRVRWRKDAAGWRQAAALRWRQAEAAFDHWSAQERSWRRAQAALALFSPEGELNTRPKAEAAVAAELPQLSGPGWEKLHSGLQRPGLFTYLDRVHGQLQALPVAAALVQAAVRVEGLRRRPEVLRGEGASARALRGVLLACGLALALAGAAGTNALALVRGVLDGAFRASSAVEGVNSVLRMQQARHRKLTQGLLDLKRLCWNVHAFRTGKRKGKTPYELLGLALPKLTFWELLKMAPEQLRQQLSQPPVAA